MMDGRHIGILLQVSILTYSVCVIRIRIPHVILHPPAILHSSRTDIGGLLTSCRFFKIAVIESEIYF